ncbi:MAG: hypothetical protein ABSB80_02990 [Methanoregula sp.]|jgi:predicted membrane protein|uniref:hypothetical protein n=1 Tax=Methanoregula sp. TaxID=2052170 RepID=UPI003D0D4FD5
MQISEVIRGYLGWCPNAPVMRTAPAVLVIPSVTVNPAQSDGGGAAGGPGRIRRGISIATGSIKTLIRDKRLLWFSFLAGLVILFLVVAEGWNVTHYDSTLPARIFIPFGDSFFSVFDIRLFLIEGICLSCFTLLLAGLVFYRNGNGVKKPVTIREGFDGVNVNAGPLAALSVVMALAATILFEITSQSQVIGKIELGISLTLFHIPYAYYIPNEVFSALYFSFEIMVINIVLFAIALYVVPGIVLENKGLLPALAGSVTLVKKTWREMLGCILVLGAILIPVAAIALLIGQSALLLNHDYDFFLQVSRGQVLMTIVCYGFLLACGILMAVGSTATGIAIGALYASGRTNTVQPVPERDTPVIAEPVR